MSMSDPKATLQAGTVLADRYVVGRLQGAGAAGQVYAALDRKLQREVAVRLLAPAAGDREASSRIGNEALAAGSLQHPNVLAVFDAGEEQGRPFLVTELLRGESLRQLLRRGPLPVEQARSFAQQIAAGLAAAHDKGLSHRDLRAENIFITGEGWVKILDFGLTAHGEPADIRSDVYNFGLLLRELLPGDLVTGGLRERCLGEQERPASGRELLIILRALEAPRPKRDLQLRRRLPMAALFAVAAVAASSFVREARKAAPPQKAVAAPVVAPAGAVAILPFDARAAPHFAALAEGVSDLLMRDFEGGSLRAVDTGSVVRAVGQGGIGDLDRALAAAAQLGAKYFVLGRIEEKNGELAIQAVLYDANTGEPLLPGGAHGPASEVLRPIRSLSDQLQGLTLSPAEFEKRLASLAFRTSKSHDALQAWIEGEHLSRRARWNESREPFRRAVDADPQFALAHYRLGTALAFSQPEVALEELEKALRYSDRLTKTERAAVEGHLALQHGALSDAERIFVDATRKYPAEAQAWLELGEFYFHQGPLLGRSPQDALTALQQALVFDPLDTESLAHLIDLAQLRGERQTVVKLTDRLLGLTDDPANLASYGLVRAWAQGDNATREQILAGLREPGTPSAAIHFSLFRTEWIPEASSGAERPAELLPLADGAQPLAAVELIHGRPDAARAAFAKSMAADPLGDSPFFASYFDTFPDFELSPEQLSAARAAAAQLASRTDKPERAPARRYVQGALAVRASDFAAAEEIARGLESMPPLVEASITTDLALALRARMQAKQGDFKTALETLSKQRLRIPQRYSDFYFWIGENFFRASLLEKLERPQEALPLYDALVYYNSLEPAFMPIAHLRKARIYEGLHEPAQAIEHYATFEKLWQGCEPAQQPQLTFVQERLAQLRGQTAAR
jgi:tetratricopeptide (TPR) repeat protein